MTFDSLGQNQLFLAHLFPPSSVLSGKMYILGEEEEAEVLVTVETLSYQEC